MKLSQTSAFPIDARRPFIGTSCGSHLHLVTLTPSRRRAQHVALSNYGWRVGRVDRLPLVRAESLGTDAETVVISGQTENDGDRVVLRFDEEKIISQHSVQIDQPLLVSPRLAVGERAWLVWAIKHNRSALCVARIEGKSVDEIAQFEFDDLIFDLRAVSTEHSLTVACLHGTNINTLELISIADASITQRVTIKDATRPTAPNLVFAGDEFVLFWITKPEHELRAQHFDEALQPLGPAAVIASAAGTEMRHARVFQAYDDRLALCYTTSRETDEWTVISEENEADRYETAFEYEQFLGSYDYEARRAGEFQKITGPPIAYQASGWAYDSLILVSETGEPAVSTYR